MGRAIQLCIAEMDDLRLAGIWSRNGAASDEHESSVVSASLATVLSSADIAIDFTLPAATGQVIAAAISANIPLVCGVSGLAAENRRCMVEAAAKIPILYDRNMSPGVAVMQQLVRLAGSVLGDQYEAEIHEIHHMHKIDAPSGTALHLGETLAASRHQDFANVYHYDKDADSPLSPGDIKYVVTRRDDVRGEHTVLFRSADESLSLIHSVTDRRVFAAGAIRAARWLLKQTSGLYDMQDLVVCNQDSGDGRRSIPSH